MAAGSQLDYHTHTCSESVTAMAGHVALEVAGRRYTLAPLDNIVIPAGLPSRGDQSIDERAGHYAPQGLPWPWPKSIETLVCEKTFPRQAMPDSSTGVPGAEYVTRQRMAERSELGSGTSSIDYFNEQLVPGIEMSGGYTVFCPGARLPAHVHDFDESISIIRGTATCIVEGHRHTLSECRATAMVSCGRVHYFINESESPMAMLWVYAGPRPERIVVDEKCATAEGNPWKQKTAHRAKWGGAISAAKVFLTNGSVYLPTIAVRQVPHHLCREAVLASAVTLLVFDDSGTERKSRHRTTVPPSHQEPNAHRAPDCSPQERSFRLRGVFMLPGITRASCTKQSSRH